MADQRGGQGWLRQGVIFAIGVVVIMVLGNTERGQGKGQASGAADRAAAINAPAPAPSPPPAPPVKVTARALLAAFDANELAALGEYGAGRVQVRGRIDRIQMADDGQPMVLMDAGRVIRWVVLRFDRTASGEIAALKAGQNFSATCGPAVMFRGSPVLFGCAVD